MDGLIAFDRNPLDHSRTGSESDIHRVVAPGVSETRTLQSVDRIAAVDLEPVQNTEELEDLQLDA